MKFLNSWIPAVLVCSALASQAHADVLMFATGDDTVAVTNLNSYVGVGNAPVQKPRASSAFVPGSLINKSSQGAWLMSQSINHNKAAQADTVSSMKLAGRVHGITPILPSGSETRPVSTFAQFVQVFKPSQNSHNNSEPVQAMVNGEITPKTSSMALIGMLASSLAGITGLITANRRGFFCRTAR